MKLTQSSKYDNSILKKLNFYGLDFPLRYRNKKLFISYLGILLSFISIILLIIIVIKYGYDLLSYSNFTVIQSQKDLDRTKIINFTESPMMLGICDNLGIPIEFNQKYFKIIMKQHSVFPLNGNNSFSGIRRDTKNIEFDICNISQQYYSIFNGFNYEKYLCPKSNQNIFIKGRYGDIRKGFDIIEIYVEKCVNSSENNYMCANEKELYDFFSKDIFLSIYFIKEAPNHFNISNPVIKQLRTDYFSISLKLRKLYMFNFLISDYLSDTGLIFPKIKKYSFGEIHNLYTDLLGDENPNSILGVIFTCVEHQIEYIRKYDKIQDMCSSLGGILTFIFEIFQYITCFISRKTFISDITNNLLNITSKSNNKIIIQTRKNINMKSLYLNKFDFSSKNIININKEESLDNKEINRLNSYNYYLKIKNKINTHSKIINKGKNKNFSFFHYFIPIILIKKMNKYSYLIHIFEIFNSLMSVENIIPIIEKFPTLLKFIMENLNFKFDNEMLIT